MTETKEKPSILDYIKKTEPKAPVITLYGKPGIGKTSLAAKFPEPLFILTEEPGISGINALPVAHTKNEFMGYLVQLLKLEELPFKTLVFDSISQLDNLLIADILDEDQKASKNGKRPNSLSAACGGYGKGYDAVAMRHNMFRDYVQRFTERGITIIFIGHLEVCKYKAPDSEDFDIYNIRINHDKSRRVYIDESDAVLFGREQAFVEELDSGKTVARSTGKAILITGINEGTVTKNRFNMPQQIEMSFEAIKKYIPFYNLNEEKEK